MINTKNRRTPLFFALALALGMSACTSDVGGGEGAFLSVQGDATLQLEPGFQRDLVVKYHDAQGGALSGEVTFEVLGVLKGSRIGDTAGATDSSGDARVSLFVGQEETVFRIKASAPAAKSVEWTVTVSEGMVAEDMDIRGTYNVDSSFDVVNGLPGNVGTVVNTIVDMTDSPYDPASYLIDSFDPGDNVSAFRPAVDAVVFGIIEDNAPDLVLDLIKLGNEFGQITKNFGVISTMQITGDNVEGTNMKAKHTITAYKFVLDGEDYIFSLDELNVDDDVISDIVVDYNNQTGLAKFAQHEVPLHYGAFLVLLLEEVIIPRLDPSARSLNQYLFNSIDCTAVGQSIADNVDGFGSPDQFKRACEVAIEAVASIVIKELREIDENGQVKLIIDGQTRMRDPSGDKKADKMTRGNWSGNMDYLGSMGPLMDGSNPFSGERTNVN